MRIVRRALARWRSFVYCDDPMPEHLKEEFADFFLAVMVSIVVGAVILRVVLIMRGID